MKIYHLGDGKTMVINNTSGFEFIIPSGWYPLLIPASSDEIQKFSTISQENNLPFAKNWVLNQPPDKMLLAAVDLDANDYKSVSGIPIQLLYLDVTRLAPSGLVAPIIDLLKSSGRVTNSYVTEYSGQEVGVVEFKSLVDETPFLGGKLLLFIKDKTLFIIVGATNNQDVISKTTRTIDDITGSLRFYAVK